MLEPGVHAPDFTLPDADMALFKLSRHKGRFVVLCFYPKDDTPACTLQAEEFSDLEQAFSRCNALVVGVSRDDCISHADFRDKYGLSMQLLADVEGEVCRKYGVLQALEKDGVRKLCVQRATFVIDPQGVLRHVRVGMPPRGHAAEMLSLLKEMNPPCISP